jgi:hypothetical protein
MITPIARQAKPNNSAIPVARCFPTRVAVLDHFLPEVQAGLSCAVSWPVAAPEQMRSSEVFPGLHS